MLVLRGLGDKQTLPAPKPIGQPLCQHQSPLAQFNSLLFFKPEQQDSPVLAKQRDLCLPAISLGPEASPGQLGVMALTLCGLKKSPDPVARLPGLIPASHGQALEPWAVMHPGFPHL